MRLTAIAAIVLCLSGGLVRAEPPPVSRAWVQMTGEGAEARLITDASACPAITIDGQARAMQMRAAASEAFPVTVCRAPLPAGAKQAATPAGHGLSR